MTVTVLELNGLDLEVVVEVYSLYIKDLHSEIFRRKFFVDSSLSSPPCHGFVCGLHASIQRGVGGRGSRPHP